jgi:cell division protein ZapE
LSKQAAIGPVERLQRLIDAGTLKPDPAQSRLAEHLQKHFDNLTANRPSWWSRLRGRYHELTGLYIHGKVGRGKTMLMDLFADCLENAGIAVWRVHFHRFMDEVHDRLKHMGDKSDPLSLVASDIARRSRVLCFDEFHVSDIGDAMILGTLMRALFERQVMLVATSNTAPDDLYADGLQRARFLPAIEAIKSQCEVICLDADDDYRLRELMRHPVYYLDSQSESAADLASEFSALAAGENISTAPLKIRGHTIQPIRRAGSVAWFDFAELCEGPRASGDYIELARRFSTLIISDVPQLSDSDNDTTRRLIHLVDECYDRAVKLIIAAAVGPADLYTGQRLAAPFERTRSRLVEMQSKDYLSLPHKP